MIKNNIKICFWKYILYNTYLKLTFINLQRQDMEDEAQIRRQPKPVVENRTRQTNERRNGQNGGSNSEYAVSGAPWHQQVCFNQNLKETFSNNFKKTKLIENFKVDTNNMDSFPGLGDGDSDPQRAAPAWGKRS